MVRFQSRLISWYKKNRRDLPWRQTKDPYKIWLSEVILQQTRVEQGTSYYLKFIENFPTVKHLARASEDKVLKLWQGLGYYSRARNLHAAAKQIVSQSHLSHLPSLVPRPPFTANPASFPGSYKELIKLKGVGQYTASAIASICFNEPRAVVDGNVYRFLARAYGITTSIDSSAGKKEFQALADELLNKRNPGEHNQAMMEFGARQCRPKNPDCSSCPFEEECAARRMNRVEQLPAKEKKTKIRTRYFHYFVFDHKGKTFLRKRENQKDIWQNLYEFPMLEMEKRESEKTVLKNALKRFSLEKGNFILSYVSPEIRHILSHQQLNARFWHFDLEKISPAMKKEFFLIKKQQVNEFALPRLIDKHWNRE